MKYTVIFEKEPYLVTIVGEKMNGSIVHQAVIVLADSNTIAQTICAAYVRDNYPDLEGYVKRSFFCQPLVSASCSYQKRPSQ